MRKGFFARIAIDNIRKNRKIYYPYILTAVITVAMLYIIHSLSANEGLRSDTLAFTLQLGVVVTTLFSVIFLFYTNSFLMKRRKKEFGLFNVLGMEKKHISRVVVLETVFILVISLLLGLGIGMLLDKLLYLIICRMIGQSLSLSFYISVPSLIITCLTIAGIFTLITLNSLRQIHRAKPIDLLRAGETGEREPKARWFIALIGAIALGAGYYLSVSVTSVVLSIFTFFIAVILVIIGTYMLFTAGSITILKILRKNKKFYYRTDHFISVSGMIYRMKQNAVGLANICILSTMVLVVVFSTVALWFGVEDMVNIRQSNDINVYANADDQVALIEETIAEELEKANLTKSNESRYAYLSVTTLKQDGKYLMDVDPNISDALVDTYINILEFMPLEDFNRVNNMSETLNDGEVLISSSGLPHTEPTLILQDMTFNVKKNLTGSFASADALVSIYNTQLVVVKDMDVLYAVDELQREVFETNYSIPRLSFNFDISGSDQEEQDFVYNLKQSFRSKGVSGYYAESKVDWRYDTLELFGGLLFIGLFLGSLFLMAMILIVYYKQISEGYEDKSRYGIMKKVGLSRKEIKRSISSQILIVFFLPLVTAGIHIVFAFPSITRMFRMLALVNVPLIATSAVVTFIVFSLLYTAVYFLTAKVYYRIVSE